MFTFTDSNRGLIILTGVLVVVVSRVIMFRVAEGHALSSASRSMIPFYDEKGILKFSVKKENLLYLESAENYVSICNINKDKVSKYLLRDTLKKIEEIFTGTEIIRCYGDILKIFPVNGIKMIHSVYGLLLSE